MEIAYFWKDIETSRGVYDFTKIDTQLNALKASGHRLIIFVMSGGYITGNNCPAYLTGSEFGGGKYLSNTGYGYFPVYWNTNVINRLVLLFQALAAKYDSDPYVEGIDVKLESALQNYNAGDPANAGVDAFNATLYKTGLEALALGARNAFSQTMTMMGYNFPTGTDTDYWAASASTNGFGIKAPDVVPTDTNLTGYSYTYFAPRSGIIPLVGFVDYPDFSNPVFGFPGSTVRQIYDYGRNNLKLTHMIWNPGFDNTVQSKINTMMNDTLTFPHDVAGGLNTLCPSMFPACNNK